MVATTLDFKFLLNLHAGLRILKDPVLGFVLCVFFLLGYFLMVDGCVCRLAFYLGCLWLSKMISWEPYIYLK